MLRMRFLKQFKLPTTRQLNTTLVRKNESSPAEKKSNKQDYDPNHPQNILGSGSHVPTKFDKRVLVWVKAYPSIDQIPPEIPWNTMYQSNVKARIRVCNYMIAFTVLGFLIAAYQGKSEAAAGRHVIGDRAKWYEEVRAKGRAEAEVRKKAEAEAEAEAATAKS